MIRKFAFVLIAVIPLLGFSLPARAQMTDDAVIEFVKDGMATGKSQNEMIKELAAAGVTKEQAERIKEAMEKDQAGQTEAVKMAGAQERQRRVNKGAMIADVGSMDIIADDIVEENDEVREVFGKNIFSNRQLSFAPSANLPTPVNYRLGPGDEVIMPTPCWVSYVEMVKIAQGKSVLVRTTMENNFCLTAEQREAAITPNTK